MIQITRTVKPKELTDEEQKKLTDAYLTDRKKTVWNQPYIRAALLKMTHCKCCYCEKKVGEGITDMHVEHFKPKSLYPLKVVEWDNLFPSCADCNRSKLDHDTGKEPIINPANEDPRRFFYLKDFRYKAFDTNENSKAIITIDVLGLNDTDKKCKPRYLITAGILERLSDICQYAKEHRRELLNDIRKRNKIVRTCRDLLKMCTPSAEYSAFTATALQTDSDYIELRKILQDINQWNDELEVLDRESKKCIFAVGGYHKIINKEGLNEHDPSYRHHLLR